MTTTVSKTISKKTSSSCVSKPPNFVLEYEDKKNEMITDDEERAIYDLVAEYLEKIIFIKRDISGYNVEEQQEYYNEFLFAHEESLVILFEELTEKGYGKLNISVAVEFLWYRTFKEHESKMKKQVEEDTVDYIPFIRKMVSLFVQKKYDSSTVDKELQESVKKNIDIVDDLDITPVQYLQNILV